MLFLGTDNSRIYKNLPANYLLIEDEPPNLAFPVGKKVTYFDHEKHSFNPVERDHLSIKNFSAIIAKAARGGPTTLTNDFGLDEIEEQLTQGKELDDLISVPDKQSRPEQVWAYKTIRRILRSPVISRVVLQPENLSFKGIIIARLNRAELGDDDCFLLGNFLMARYKGHIIIPDYGTYASPHHLSLIRQGRLRVAVNYLDELPKELMNPLILGEVSAASCLPKDAEELAGFSGYRKGSKGYEDFVKRAVG